MHPLMSKRKADTISTGVLLIALGILLYTDAWWPGILIAIAATFAIRQFLTGKKVELIVTLTILGFILLFTFAGVAFSIIIPVLFVLGGIYLIIREFFFRNGLRWSNHTDNKYE